MSLTPTPVTAALCGIFSGIAWPLLRPVLTGTESASGIGLILGTVVLVALPAHAFVVGFNRRQVVGAGAFDSALLVRIGFWLSSAAISAVLVSIFRGSA